MKDKNINQEAYFERLRELGAVNKQLIKETKSTSTLLDYKRAGDGRLYGIVKENQAYFIKTAHNKSVVSDADFAYIGGLSNITEYKCKSLTEAQRVLNTKVMTINETYGGMMEDEQEEDMPAPAPMPAPQPEGKPSPAPMPTPSPEPEAQPQPEEKEGKDEVHSAISTAAGLFSGADIEPSKVEYYLKQFLGVIKDSQLSKLRDDQKDAIFGEYFGSEQVEEGYSINEVEEFMMTPGNVAALISGVAGIFGVAGGIGALMDKLKQKNPKLAKKIEGIASAAGSGIKGGTTSVEEGEHMLKEMDEFMMTPENVAAILLGVSSVIGGAYGIDKLQSYLKKKNPKVAKELESMGKSAGSGIKGGSTSLEEGDDYLTEEEMYEDDMLDDMEDELDINTPDMEDMTVDVEDESGAKEVHIDLNSGTVNVKLSESRIKELATKYNVTESYIKWKMKDVMQEEVEKIEKEKLKEEKVRKVVRNIIKEKLGLKKKSLTESVSKERSKLEKLVESVLKKNM